MTVRHRKCRICGKPVAPRAENRAFPLCSERCRLVDLGRWLDEAYVISEPQPADESTPEPGDGGDPGPSGRH